MKEPDVWKLSELTMEITYKCPLRCEHCSSHNRFSSPSDELTKTQITTIIDDFVDLGGELLEISGGEPLCHPYVFETVDYAKKSGLTVYLYTCGILENNENSLEPIDRDTAYQLNNQKVDKVFVNLEGANDETHDSITGVLGSFKQLENAVKNLVEEGVHVSAHFVPMKPNYKQLPKVLDYAAKMGIREVGVLRFVPQGRGRVNKEQLTLSKSQIKRLIIMFNEERKRMDIRVRLGAPIDFCFLLDVSHDPPPCTAGLDKCLIMANGNVIPCPAYKELPSYVAGNIYSMSLSEIWKKSKVLKQFRVFDFKHLEGPCAKCVYLNSCRGRCHAQRILEHRDLYGGPNGYCIGSELDS